MDTYHEHVVANVAFLEARARDLADQEIDRARSLDGKATALVAVIVALIAAGVAFAARMPDIPATSGARVLWASQVGAALMLLLAAGGFAVAAVIPRAVRTAMHISEVRRWRSEPYLMQEPTLVQGMLLNANVDSVGHSRGVNAMKATRLKIASSLFAAALASIVALAISLAVHDATREPPNNPASASSGASAGGGRDTPANGRADVSDAADGSQARGRLQRRFR